MQLPFTNILPCDGEVYFAEDIHASFDSRTILHHMLNEIPWDNDTVKLFGKTVVCKRRTAWIADRGISYTYSGMKKHPASWTPILQDLRQYFRNKYGFSFNSCLLNLYENGSESMSWHSDDEKALGPEPLILSLSLGAERKFSFRHKISGTKTDVVLKNGSVLLMAGKTQQYWKHCLPKSAKVKDMRINLTFRTILL